MDDPNHFLDRNQTHSLVMGPFRYNHREIDTVFPQYVIVSEVFETVVENGQTLLVRTWH